ncbi:DUF2191 domain-containing protein [Epidermidibacterium keratini]|uniref:DUF2191 domain-containing protein n=1 Tax=Epidermidibacterium keratini TaxID=1891644 RepID=A0A7L4YHA6_9ACTN|nr:DUF2191 domain-containing protein [Epidermidibacterium keratini]QHB98964.1 DUF2191 domain-containing protein [Epidermidibacterium keratini]
MRTTVNIDADLLRRAKELAARSDRSLGDVVDDALRVLLLRGETATPRAPVTLTQYGSGGLRPGVDLDNKDAMAELLDDDVTHAAR